MAQRSGVVSFLIAGFATGLVAVLYNVFVFKFLGFYPDLWGGVSGGLSDTALMIFVKDFFLGFLLAALFRAGCLNINYHMGKGIFFFILYSVVAFLMFSVGDLVLMGSNEKILLLLSLDGFVETLLCTIPIRLLSKDCFR